MSLSDDCQRDFGTKSLYGVLGVEKTATTKELTKAYRKPSFFLLPAQAPAHRLEEFCRKFEILSKVHYILSDEKKRQVYDKTGIVEVSVDNFNPNYWTKHWRNHFPHIVPEDIQDYKERYKDSEEEKEDIKIAYLRAKGDMNRFAEIYFAYTAEDEDRLCWIMQKDLINKKKMHSYVKFMNEKPSKIETRKNKYKKPHPEDDPASINPIILVLRQKKIDTKESRSGDDEAVKDEVPLRKWRRR